MLSTQDLDRLEQLLDAPALAEHAMTLDTLQGYLCAIISGPELIPPSTWLPEVIGSPEFDSVESVEELTGLLMALYNDIAAALHENEPLDLILYGSEEDPDTPDYAAWVDGYLYGSQTGPDWFEQAGGEDDAEMLSGMLEPLFILNGSLKADVLEQGETWMSDEKEQEMLELAREDLPDILLALHHFWLERRQPGQTIRRQSAKVGRNDPCPCGSGRKYKQCCGANPTVH